MNIVFDLEVYSNYFLATFVREDGKIILFTRFNDCDSDDLQKLAWDMLMYDKEREQHTLISFNGKRYDMPLLSLAINGGTNAQLKAASDQIIQDNAMWWIIENEYNFKTLDVDHIDIINLLPLYESLKMYGARNSTEMLQDLPFDPASVIDSRMATELRSYCLKDCKLTWELFVSLWPEIQLRITLGQQYNQDLRSKSDAQIAEAVMMSQFKEITGFKLMKPIDAGGLPTEVWYQAPDWVNFTDPKLSYLVIDLQDQGFQLHPNNGKPLAPDWLKRKTVNIAGKKYAVGLGGLHSQNKSESYFSGSRGQLIDIDVASYYPAIILNNGYEPPHMGATFTEIYGGLVKQRLAAKAAGDTVTSAGLKITINGTYGKLGSRYSAVYAPQLLLAVTFTGQLALLMLIEMMAEKGIQCVSANTDGLTIMATDRDYEQIVEEWESRTGFVMEYTQYKQIHYRDVNNYFALTTDGQLKTKGVFRATGLNKNPAAHIVMDAVMNYVLDLIPIKDTIYGCPDIRPFLTARKVAGGGAKDGEYLGKAVRWYYSNKTETGILYVSNGNLVAKSTGAMPMMDLQPGLPNDLDYDWYVREANEMLDLIGYYPWA